MSSDNYSWLKYTGFDTIHGLVLEAHRVDRALNNVRLARARDGHERRLRRIRKALSLNQCGGDDPSPAESSNGDGNQPSNQDTLEEREEGEGEDYNGISCLIHGDISDHDLSDADFQYDTESESEGVSDSFASDDEFTDRDDTGSLVIHDVKDKGTDGDEACEGGGLGS
ncbi:unnamed protein product [Clonostachys byssicola]|uniref:Uncharacterized protein n=1 Tax=Clonostachys byssicola TaxID=160290 RepID=A0A9N9ULN1_9HYPO|nr:unnamed protein product [Clonostachys byssicola]